MRQDNTAWQIELLGLASDDRDPVTFDAALAARLIGSMGPEAGLLGHLAVARFSRQA